MTRKDYVKMADAIRSAYQITKTTNSPLMSAGISLAAESVANALKADNPKFDRDRFLAACRGE